MKEKEFDKKSFFWEADVETYNELQKLIKFVSFVSNLKECSEEDKRKASKIIDVIKYFNHAELISHFGIDLDLKDHTVTIGSNKKPGIYLRKWRVWFECGFFQIEAASYHSDEPGEYFDDQYWYNNFVSFRKDHDSSNGFERIYIKQDINEFVEDALNYKSYLTNTLKDIEVDIDFWG